MYLSSFEWIELIQVIITILFYQNNTKKNLKKIKSQLFFKYKNSIRSAWWYFVAKFLIAIN